MQALVNAVLPEEVHLDFGGGACGCCLATHHLLLAGIGAARLHQKPALHTCLAEHILVQGLTGQCTTFARKHTMQQV